MDLRHVIAIALLATAGCIGWQDSELERSRQAATAPEAETGARNRAAILELQQPRPNAEPAQQQMRVPTAESSPRRMSRLPIVVPSPIPSASSTPLHPSQVIIPFTPSPPVRETVQLRVVPPYTLQMPAGSVYPNTFQCVPDLAGGSVCR